MGGRHVGFRYCIALAWLSTTGTRYLATDWQCRMGAVMQSDQSCSVALPLATICATCETGRREASACCCSVCVWPSRSVRTLLSLVKWKESMRQEEGVEFGFFLSLLDHSSRFLHCFGVAARTSAAGLIGRLARSQGQTNRQPPSGRDDALWQVAQVKLAARRSGNCAAEARKPEESGPSENFPSRCLFCLLR